MKTLVEKCENKQVAETELWKEIMKGNGVKTVQCYKDAGCFDCDGYRDDCDLYFSYDEKFLEWKREYGK